MQATVGESGGIASGIMHTARLRGVQSHSREGDEPEVVEPVAQLGAPSMLKLGLKLGHSKVLMKF